MKLCRLISLALFLPWTHAVAETNVNKPACNDAEFIIDNQSTSITVKVNSASDAILSGIPVGAVIEPGQPATVGKISEETSLILLGKTVRPLVTISFVDNGVATGDISQLKGKYKDMGNYCETSAQMTAYLFENFSITAQTTNAERNADAKITFTIVDTKNQ